MSIFRTTLPQSSLRRTSVQMPPAWSGPPEEHLATIVPLGLVFGTSSSAAAHLTRADVYPTGMSLWVDIFARALDDSDRDRIVAIEQAIFGDPERLGYLSQVPDWMVRYATIYDGQVVSTSLEPVETDGDGGPVSPVTRQIDHGSRSGGLRWRTQHELWLWPLPVDRTLEVAMEWPALGIAESKLSLDAQALCAAAEESHPVW